MKKELDLDQLANIVGGANNIDEMKEELSEIWKCFKEGIVEKNLTKCTQAIIDVFGLVGDIEYIIRESLNIISLLGNHQEDKDLFAQVKKNTGLFE